MTKVLRKFNVVASDGTTKEVVSDYFNLDHMGNLAFRNTNSGGYPTTVALYAAGAWSKVEEVQEVNPETGEVVS